MGVGEKEERESVRDHTTSSHCKHFMNLFPIISYKHLIRLVDRIDRFLEISGGSSLIALTNEPGPGRHGGSNYYGQSISFCYLR